MLPGLVALQIINSEKNGQQAPAPEGAQSDTATIPTNSTEVENARKELAKPKTARDKLAASDLGKYVLDNVWGKVDGEVAGQPRPNWEHLATLTIQVGDKTVNAAEHLKHILELALNSEKQAGADITQLKADAAVIMQMVSDFKAGKTNLKTDADVPAKGEDIPVVPVTPPAPPEVPVSPIQPEGKEVKDPDSEPPVEEETPPAQEEQEKEQEQHEEVKEEEYAEYNLENQDGLPKNATLAEINSLLKVRKDEIASHKKDLSDKKAALKKVEEDILKAADADALKLEEKKKGLLEKDIRKLETEIKRFEREVLNLSKAIDSAQQREDTAREREDRAENSQNQRKENELRSLKQKLSNDSARLANTRHNELKREMGRGASEWGLKGISGGFLSSIVVPDKRTIQRDLLREKFLAETGVEADKRFNIDQLINGIAQAMVDRKYPSTNKDRED